VWSVTRRYPGMSTRAREVGLDELIRLNTEVKRDRPRPDGSGWTLTIQGPDGLERTDEVDHLVVGNGVFCEPMRPSYPGEAEFTPAGGRLTTAAEFPDVEQASSSG